MKDPRLQRLRDGLLGLHTTLLASTKATYERDVARIQNTNHYLQLVLADPWFVWLRELSGLVVAIDEAQDAKEAADVAAFLTRARALLTPSEGAEGFAGKYFETLQRDPEIVLAHGRMMKTLAGLV